MKTNLEYLARRKARYQQRRFQGFCGSLGCTQLAEPNKSLCPYHLEARMVAERKIVSKRKSNGLCIRCGQLRNKSKILCDKHLELDRLHARGNPKRMAAYHHYYQRIRLECLQAYSGPVPSCDCCGEDNLMLLTIDHIKNDGAQHRRDVGSNQVYTWLKKNKFPKGFAVRCFNCNLGRRVNHGGDCPAHAEHARLKIIRTGLVYNSVERSVVQFTTVNQEENANGYSEVVQQV